MFTDRLTVLEMAIVTTVATVVPELGGTWNSQIHRRMDHRPLRSWLASMSFSFASVRTKLLRKGAELLHQKSAKLGRAGKSVQPLTWPGGKPRTIKGRLYLTYTEITDRLISQSLVSWLSSQLERDREEANVDNKNGKAGAKGTGKNG